MGPQPVHFIAKVHQHRGGRWGRPLHRDRKCHVIACQSPGPRERGSEAVGTGSAGDNENVLERDGGHCTNATELCT